MLTTSCLFTEKEALFFILSAPYVCRKTLLSHAEYKKPWVTLLEEPLLHFPEKQALYLQEDKNKETFKKNWEKMEKEGIFSVSFLDPSYPSAFKKLKNFPLTLFIQGNISLLTSSFLGIIGTRAASYYGTSVASSFATYWSSQGIPILSGLARGIDTAAHSSAVLSGSTCAIIGSGFFHLYPKENTSLAKKIIEKGCLVSEYFPWIPPLARYFPERNRLIAALSTALLVVEAPLKSGSMITAKQAIDLKTPLFAAPGPIFDENFLGSHTLLKEGKATIAIEPQDFTSFFEGVQKTEKQVQPSVSLEVSLSLDEKTLYEKISYTEINIEHLYKEINLPVHKINYLLIILLMKKLIKELPGKNYTRIGLGLK